MGVYLKLNSLTKKFTTKRSYLIILGLLLSFPLASLAQSNRMTRLYGKVTDRAELPLEGVTVQTQPGGKKVLSASDGTFHLDGLPEGDYTASCSLVGYHTGTVKFRISGDVVKELAIVLEKETKELSEVKVTGATAASNARQGYNVSAVDATKLGNTTYDLNQALSKVSGVRVRESGGLGSTFNFSLNGFSGNQVKFFLDGLPMDNFGTSFQTNNIPINLAERIEVYKGVVPVWLGADALGGAVNIITCSGKKDYLDVSYSYGSFNTHKSAINASVTGRSGFTVQLNAFQNYSDNNYRVKAEVADLITGIYTTMRVRRFHDRYHSETIILNTGVTGRSYADKLLIGITLGRNDADIQTGNRMFDVYGARSRNGRILMPSLKYLKTDLFTQGLSLSMNASYNLGSEQNIDTAFKQYNWLGQYRNKSNDPNAVGGELSRTLYRFRNHAAQATSLLSYKINERHSVVVNSTFLGFNRTGSDELDPQNVLNRQPRKNLKYITGVAYRMDVDPAWNWSVFLKDYRQHTTAFTSYKPTDGAYGTAPVYTESQRSLDRVGFGAALNWFALPELQAKLSFEKAYRLPENDELFGNPTTDLLSNFSLNPEHADNVNIGFVYAFPRFRQSRITLESNLIYRNAKDFIRPSLITYYGVSMVQMLNQADVRVYGVDGTVRYNYQDRLTISANLTWQNIRNETKYLPNTTEVSDIYHDRLPNMPFLFGNAGFQYLFKQIGPKGNDLSFGYSLGYVHEYFLNWPSQGQAGTKPIIPGQVQQDANVLYTINNGKYNVGLECRNLFNADIYDNFSLQKPGRAFYIKLRYFISAKHL